MRFLLAFLPFIAFAVASSLGYPLIGLCLAMAVAGGTLAHAWMRPERRVHVLDAGTFILFAAVAAYTAWQGQSLAISLVRAIVDAGLCLVVLATVALGRPFTRDFAPPGLASEPGRQRAYQVTSLAWAAAVAVFVAADLALWRDVLTARQVTFVIVGVAFATYRFSRWYVARGATPRPRPASSGRRGPPAGGPG
jgi:intracellular septation protein A